MSINLTLLMQAVAFGLFIWFCAKFIWPPLMRTIETRQTQIADGLAAGEEGRHALANAEKRIAVVFTNSSAKAAHTAFRLEFPRMETLRVESEPGICTTPFRFLGYASAAASRTANLHQPVGESL